MKVEEIYHPKKRNQVGVVFQRTYFATEIDIFPKLNPLAECEPTVREETEDTMSELTSVQTEERVSQAVRHQTNDSDEEFQPIPLKRLDSGAHQHNIQGSDEAVAATKASCESCETSTHRDLLDDIDKGTSEPESLKTKNKTKKEGTLKRMLKGIRVDKESADAEPSESISVSKLFQRINPVGKASRESFSKVFHRIGDALHKKPEEAESNGQGKDSETSANHKKVGEKKFKPFKIEKTTD